MNKKRKVVARLKIVDEMLWDSLEDSANWSSLKIGATIDDDYRFSEENFFDHFEEKRNKYPSLNHINGKIKKGDGRVIITSELQLEVNDVLATLKIKDREKAYLEGKEIIEDLIDDLFKKIEGSIKAKFNDGTSKIWA